MQGLARVEGAGVPCGPRDYSRKFTFEARSVVPGKRKIVRIRARPECRREEESPAGSTIGEFLVHFLLALYNETFWTIFLSPHR